jgi:hypothetical protein
MLLADTKSTIFPTFFKGSGTFAGREAVSLLLGGSAQGGGVECLWSTREVDVPQ